MKYLGNLHVEKNGHTTFDFRMNEKELGTLALLIAMANGFWGNKKAELYDGSGNNITQTIKSLRHGLRQAQTALKEDKEKNNG